MKQSQKLLQNSTINPFAEIISARRHLENVLSLGTPHTFWWTFIKFCYYVLGRAQDSLTQGSFDTLPEFKAIDLQIDDLFNDVQNQSSADF